MVKGARSHPPPHRPRSLHPLPRRFQRASVIGLCVLLCISLSVVLLFLSGFLALPNGTHPSLSDEISGGASVSLRFPAIYLSRQHLPRKRQLLHKKAWVEMISWEPRAFIYHNFLSEEECKYLINLAKPHMVKSSVVDNETGKSKDSRVRTSSGTFLSRGQDEIIRSIEKRISDFTFIPVEHGEGIQILHYEVGQKYEAHYDYFQDTINIKNGGQRIATLLMYLSDVEEGGETVFPSANINNSRTPPQSGLSECAKNGLSVRPKLGDALLFWSMRPDASLDPSSLHGGCPVIRGNKWSATKWMHVNEYKR